MEYKFIARLCFMQANVLNRGKRIYESLRVSNNQELVRDFFNEQVALRSIGTMEAEYLLEGCFVYAKGEVVELQDKLGNDEDEEFTMQIVNHFLKVTQTFTTCLWLIKDNSVNTENGFCYVSKSKITGNMRTSWFSNARGEFTPIKFTHEEISQALAYFELFEHGISESYLNPQDLHDEYNTADKVTRAFYFLQAGRSQSHLPSKIAMYCTILEIFFTTDNTEVNHKVAERTARFLGETQKERIELFGYVKRAYNIRSTTLHGGVISGSNGHRNKMADLCEEVDNIVRRVFLKIIGNEDLNSKFMEGNAEHLNKWYTEIIFE